MPAPASDLTGATLADVASAANAAADSFQTWRRTNAESRAAFLTAIASQLADSREVIVSTADAETLLGRGRLDGELDRTIGQLRAFAALVGEGSYVHAIISPADPGAAPPRPDIRRMSIPIGPVAVFTPSNFPLAFGVAGGDTAAALAAGCSVIVKAHPLQPETSAACARAIRRAANATSAPPGVVSLLHAGELAVARALVTAPEIKAVAFTGSLAAGRAVHDLAASRPEPIPVYAEMGSLNPLFVGPAALRSRGDQIAEGLASSIALGTGQFCTKPGLAFVVDDARGRQFAATLADRLASREPGPMVAPSLADQFDRLVARTVTLEGVERLTPHGPASGALRAPTLIAVPADVFFTMPALQEEHFGPFSIVVFCRSAEAMIDAAARLPGSLTATVHADADDNSWARALLDGLGGRAGRLVWNGYPTGVAVVPAMQHGGPYPASTAPAHTSVGATAIARFLRPVAYQNVPDAFLPEALRDANPLRIQRLVDGRWTRDVIQR